MLHKSTYNIEVKLHNDRYLIVNLLTGEADILNSTEYEKLQKGEPLQEFIEKGYLIDTEEEKILYSKKYLEFLKIKEEEELQLFFVPEYSCNFDCSYCFQKDYSNPTNNYDKAIIDAFFIFVQKQFKNRKKYITLFGGEPLLISRTHLDFIKYFLEKSRQANIDVAIVTNGYYLSEYISIFKDTKVKIREIQVTLDGIEKVHDERRKLKGGQGTFWKIVEGIDLSIKEDYPINLRVVVDADNIENLKDLAKFAIDKGWANYSKFKTQIGRNYELHSCTYNAEKLFSREKLYENLLQLIQKYPYLLQFHKPDFFIVRELMENGKLPEPVFDACPATKSEWAFDYTGKIYPCTATVGKEGEEIGTFYPNINLNIERIDQWSERDVLSINECKSCEVQLICGGGCAALAKNNKGDIFKPDCRPIKNIIKLGMSLYFNKGIQ